MRRIILTATVLSLLSADPQLASAGELNVAAATNILAPIEEIAKIFGERHAVKLNIISGSTGKLYSQIIEGAPFHVFLAADAAHPILLEKKGLSKPRTRFTYAVGSLVVWSNGRKVNLKGKDLTILKDKDIKKIAIPNPKTAPYGKAAAEALEEAGLLSSIEEKFVYAETAAQAFSFAYKGGADAAIVPISTIYGVYGKKDNYFKIDAAFHSPIIQQAIVLKNAPREAMEFLEFLKTNEARKILEKYGYSKN